MSNKDKEILVILIIVAFFFFAFLLPGAIMAWKMAVAM